MSDINQDLRKYAVYQLMSYINEQTRGRRVSSGDMERLGKGVENICRSAFGEEYYPLIRQETPKIIRAALEARQLGLRGKMMKFLDSTKPHGSGLVSMILGDMMGKHPTIINSEKADMIKATWVEKMKAEKTKTLEKTI